MENKKNRNIWMDGVGLIKGMAIDFLLVGRRGFTQLDDGYVVATSRRP